MLPGDGALVVGDVEDVGDAGDVEDVPDGADAVDGPDAFTFADPAPANLEGTRGVKWPPLMRGGGLTSALDCCLRGVEDVDAAADVDVDGDGFGCVRTSGFLAPPGWYCPKKDVVRTFLPVSSLGVSAIVAVSAVIRKWCASDARMVRRIWS